MGKLVVSLDNVVIKEFQITKERTTLGRRPYNDIVIDNLAVSGEHAVLTAAQSDVFIEDLNSTNGTYINGKAVKKQLLSNNDVVEVGKYRIKFLAEDAEDYEKTMILRPGAFGRAPGTIGAPPPAGPAAAGGVVSFGPQPVRRARDARASGIESFIAGGSSPFPGGQANRNRKKGGFSGTCLPAASTSGRIFPNIT